MKHILFLLLLTGVCMPEASAQDKGRLRAEADHPQGPAADKGGA